MRASRRHLRACVPLTGEKGDDPLFGVLLSSFHGKFVQHLHLNGKNNKMKAFKWLKHLWQFTGIKWSTWFDREKLTSFSIPETQSNRRQRQPDQGSPCKQFSRPTASSLAKAQGWEGPISVFPWATRHRAWSVNNTHQSPQNSMDGRSSCFLRTAGWYSGTNHGDSINLVRSPPVRSWHTPATGRIARLAQLCS